ncbi:hypothetical protein [Streptomyces zaomyceticus]|uniref:hypothetical protein n=1 Tax=Streptomyces zaomyceticus TaxID=68286 RepID=UPI002E0D2BDF|nr:hypothetical protein OG237_15640 [Streptomyces zaomyceticus]
MHVAKGGILAGVAAAVGAVLIAASTVTNHTGQFRLGLVAMLCGLTGVLCARASADTQRLIAHQSAAARLTARERQEYVEMGWRAKEIDAATTPQLQSVEAEIVQMPLQRPTSYVTRDGSA